MKQYFAIFAPLLALALAGPAAAQSSSVPGGPEVFVAAAGAADEMSTPGYYLAATSHYHFIPAAAFTLRDAGDSKAYRDGGCVRPEMVASDGMLAVTLDIPDGAALLGLRIYYQGTTTSDSYAGWITSLDNAGDYTDLVYVPSDPVAGASDYGSHYVALATPETVDHYNKAYVAYLRASSVSPAAWVCGVRVFYEMP